MRFAHMSDVHLGAFRDAVLRDYNVAAFEKALSLCGGVDFVIIAGDLFHVALPEMSVVDRAVKAMRLLREKGVRIYVVYGSHDYSPNETSIIDVLCSADVLRKVVLAEYGDDGKLRLGFVKDESGAKITGMSARRAGLEKGSYCDLDLRSLEKEGGTKIFVFHSAIDEYKPDFLGGTEGIPLSLFPKSFAYYAGGHVHERLEKKERGFAGPIVFPGPLWAADYRDLEELSKKKSGFYVVEITDGAAKTTFTELDICGVQVSEHDASDKSAFAVNESLQKVKVEKGRIVLLRVSGELESGKPSEIDFSTLKQRLLDEGATAVYVNRNALRSREEGEVRVEGASRREIEEKVFQERAADFKSEVPQKAALELLDSLRTPITEGERKADYEASVVKKGLGVLHAALES
ncbi:double-stranded DNA repair protein Mre11 [Candidatus Micrarchaeota archaeon CG10_big_fil_rev_8_21_14_0_10_59_7]|nr:MAG: double-stranded DNA repair protein Mre11 [Candidatus Micrarchaeota archaeon CG10_big_fil_rev_8_21_14_0_10_59_7]